MAALAEVTAPRLRLIEYVRVSKVGGRDGDSFQSPQQQRKANRSIVNLTPGGQIVETIEELDESGGTMNRDGLQRAIRMVESGEADGIVVAWLDRWARTVETLELIERWAAEGKAFISAAERFDAATSHGKFALGMMLLVAKYYRDRSIEQWDSAVAGAIGRGVSISVPYGYRRADGNGSRLVPDEPAASVVRRIYAERAAGRGVAAIADGLNADGIQSARGTWWTRGSLQALVKVRTYLGEAGKGSHTNREAHEALVDELTWRAAQSRGRVQWVHGDGALLSRIVRCASCGWAMSSGSGGSGARRYGCGRNHSDGKCPGPSTINAERLEELVEALFLERHCVAVRPIGTTDPAVEKAAALAEKRHRQYVQWRDDVDMAESLGDDEYRASLVARKRAWDDAIDAYESTVRRADASSLTVDVDGYWSLSMVERRQLLARALERVVIRRAVAANEPLPNRVELVWAA